MKCTDCQSQNIIALEEQGEFTLRIKYISKVFILFLFLIFNMISIVLCFQNIMSFDYMLRYFIVSIVVSIILYLICSLHNSIVRRKTNKLWIQKSRTKFVCMDCGNQWYKYSEKEEFFRH